MHDRPFLVVRERPLAGRPHAYDVVLDWIRENFPDYLPLFRLASLPMGLGEAEFSLHVAWLSDPVQAHSIERYTQATALAAECDARGIPVINRVDRLINATKSLGATLIAQAGLRVPKMVPITDAAEFRETLCGMTLPLILRDDWGHQGELLRADTMDEARALPIDRFLRPIAVELIDVRDPRDGYCRKYRYFAIGDVGVSSHLQISNDWITRGRERVAGDNSRSEELDYIGRPDPNHAALQRARRAMGLDYLAFDYGYDHDGQVVVWEANPYPHLHFSTKNLVYRNASMHRTMAGILRLYLDRAGFPVPERLEEILDPSSAPSSTWTGHLPLPVTLTEDVSSPDLRCVGEFSVTIEAGDTIQLAADHAGTGSILVLSRADDGRATLIPLHWEPIADPPRATLAVDATGPLLLTVLAEAAIASSRVALIVQSAGGSSKRLEASAPPISTLYRARAFLPANGEHVDHFRIRSTLGGVAQYCLAALSLDAKTVEGCPFSSAIKASYRYVNLTAGTSQIPNPFRGPGACVFLLLPWPKGPWSRNDRIKQIKAITGFEGLKISRVVGEVTPVGDKPEPAPPVQDADEERQTLWAIDQAHEAQVAQLIELTKKTTSDELRQEVADRLVAMNRSPDSLISRPGVRARAVSSFRRALISWSRRAELQGSSLGIEKALEWRVKDKEHGYRLAGMLDATLLDRRGPFSPDEALDAAARAPRPVVLKPIGRAGSWGVFVLHGPQAILDLRRHRWMASLDALRAEVEELGSDHWLVEDFAADSINELCPAADLKFYSFYGRVGIVLEVERYPTTRYSWWTRDGSPVFTGHYAGQLFEGRGFLPEALAEAERLSAELPFPFMRIDLLRAKDALFFGEFTPRSGEFDAFIPELDAFLGELYLDAELRLWRDLLAGKRFAIFNQWAARFLHVEPRKE